MGFHRLSSEFYCRWYTGDANSLDDDSLLFALELMVASGYAHTVLYDREYPPEPAEWLSFCQQEKFLFFMLYDAARHVPIAIVWLEACTATGAQRFVHFCTFKTGNRDQFLRGGKALLAWIGEATGIRQLIGVTPACYRHALALVYDMGFSRLTRLEKAVFCLGKHRDAVLTISNLSTLRG